VHFSPRRRIRSKLLQLLNQLLLLLHESCGCCGSTCLGWRSRAFGFTLICPQRPSFSAGLVKLGTALG